MGITISQIDEAAAAIRQRWNRRPAAGIILGTGLGSFAKEVEQEAVIRYDEIPHFVRSTAMGHAGQLVCGSVGGLPVITMEGRFHLYEGYSPQQITFPVRVMKALGIELLLVSNASGGLKPSYTPGDIVVMEDHINLMSASPLAGLNDDAFGPRFPDMSQPYDSKMIERALRIARRENIVAHKGVYVAVSGPNYETRAEYRFFRKIGADVIGMSTVPEAIVAAQLGLRVLALSVVTNRCLPDAPNQTDGAEVVAAAHSAEPKLRAIVLGVLREECAARNGLDSSKSSSEKIIAAD